MNQLPHQQQAGDQGRDAGDKQIDDNQDEFGRDVNDPENRIGDKATVDKTKQDRAHEMSQKIGLQRGLKRDRDDPSSSVTGGFSQKH